MTQTIKAIGRKATKCRKCGGQEHWVNKLGGLSCIKCSPAKDESEAVATLLIRSGIWADAAVPDEWDCSPSDSREAGVGNTWGNSGSRAMDAQRDAEILPRTEDGRCEREDQNEKDKRNSDSSGLRSTQSTRPTILAYQRGPSGELSGVELDLFTSDALWAPQPRDPLNPESDTHQWVTLKPKVRLVITKSNKPEGVVKNGD